MRVVGVDEAGRGCVIGPLVIAGVAFPSENIPWLIEIGVKDSKKLTRRRRESLVEEITSLASEVAFFELQPYSIDSVVSRGIKLKRLNYLEAVAMAAVIRRLSPDEAYVDASDVNETRYGETILRLLSVKPKLISEHKADTLYPVVSAASILAKVRRDSIVAELRELFGDFNSGYPSDKKTIKWLKTWYMKHQAWPDFVRRSWTPIKRIRHEASQTKPASAIA